MKRFISILNAQCANRKIKLQGCNLGRFFVRELVTIFYKDSAACSSVREISLAFNRIGEEGATRLGRMLAVDDEE